MKLAIKYYRRCPEWDQNTRPSIVDAETGEVLAEIHQFVGHPGQYDERADELAKLIVASVNQNPHQVIRDVKRWYD